MTDLLKFVQQVAQKESGDKSTSHRISKLLENILRNLKSTIKNQEKEELTFNKENFT